MRIARQVVSVAVLVFVAGAVAACGTTESPTMSPVDALRASTDTLILVGDDDDDFGGIGTTSVTSPPTTNGEEEDPEEGGTERSGGTYGSGH